ncbi:MAG TPA: hypothetical protein VF545_02995 [Thermoleophilaceae bacterium]
MRRAELLRQFGLLLLKHVERNRPGILDVIRYELTALPLDVLDVAPVPRGLLLAIARREPEHLHQSRLEHRDALGIELDFVDVELSDEVIDAVGGEVRKVARGSVVPAGADEVVVLAAVASGAPRELEAPAADAAKDRSFQVVLVLPLVLPGDCACGENLLDPRERVLIDER